MSNQFTRTPVMNIPSNSFDYGHDHTTTCDGGYIIPVLCEEALPGDYFKYNNKTLVRLQPLVSPAMAKMDVTMITGFVPNRLLWSNSEKFFAEPVPSVTTPVPPYFDNIVVNVGDLAEYLGVPTHEFKDDAGNIVSQYLHLDDVSALPLAAYQKFYADWFRDENLVNGGVDTFRPLTDGLNPYADYSTLRRRAWRHDYFTSALPFAQKGQAVSIPLGSFAPITFDPTMMQSPEPTWRTTNGGGLPGTVNITGEFVPGFNEGVIGQSASTDNLAYDPKNTLYADLQNATAVTINTLRWAEKLQVFLEKNARGGTRYTEIVLQHFGIHSSDARLQRAEFLGFAVNPVIISEVLQTSESTPTGTPQGEMAGHGISYGGSRFVQYQAEEHGFFLTFLSIRPKTMYMQGLSKMWRRKSPLDYAWPTFAHLGEQEVLQEEIYVTNTVADKTTFGYLPRYAEYRFANDRVSGEMRTSLNHWHMGRIFPSPPALNEAFINCAPTERVFAVNTAGVHNYIVNVRHNLTIRRRLPKYGIPAL